MTDPVPRGDHHQGEAHLALVGRGGGGGGVRLTTEMAAPLWRGQPPEFSYEKLTCVTNSQIAFLHTLHSPPPAHSPPPPRSLEDSPTNGRGILATAPNALQRPPAASSGRAATSGQGGFAGDLRASCCVLLGTSI